jgi:hypothetical protein
MPLPATRVQIHLWRSPYQRGSWRYTTGVYPVRCAEKAFTGIRAKKLLSSLFEQLTEADTAHAHVTNCLPRYDEICVLNRLHLRRLYPLYLTHWGHTTGRFPYREFSPSWRLPPPNRTSRVTSSLNDCATASVGGAYEPLRIRSLSDSTFARLSSIIFAGSNS